jgi:hypothetical protein
LNNTSPYKVENGWWKIPRESFYFRKKDSNLEWSDHHYLPSGSCPWKPAEEAFTYWLKGYGTTSWNPNHVSPSWETNEGLIRVKGYTNFCLNIEARCRTIAAIIEEEPHKEEQLSFNFGE